MHLAGGEVEREVFEREQLLALGVDMCTPEQAPDPGQQLVQGEGLGQVVVRAGVEAVDLVTHLVTRRQQQDGHTVTTASEMGEESEAVELGIITSSTIRSAAK